MPLAPLNNKLSGNSEQTLAKNDPRSAFIQILQGSAAQQHVCVDACISNKQVLSFEWKKRFWKQPQYRAYKK